MEPEFWVWLGLVILFIVLELPTTGLTTIWFAAGSLVGFFLALAHAPLPVQIVAAILVSLLLLIFARPFFRKLFGKNMVKTNVDSLIGEYAKVTEQIDNINGTGYVTVKGQDWMARTKDDSVTVEQGTLVEILAISGVKVIVKPADNAE